MGQKGNTVNLHRVFAATPEKVFRAFMNPDAQAQWIPPYGFICKVHEFNPVVGGQFKMSFINFTTEKEQKFGGQYLEIEPRKKIKYSDKFDDQNLSGEIIVTIELREVSCGTEISITQENIPTVIPVEMCYLGWQQSLIKLGQLIETNIQD
jgi:uncharacterized protein YndB with AHSA1/START domain